MIILLIIKKNFLFVFQSFLRRYIRPHLALGGVKNVSLNLTVSNAGDDAYDTNIYLNFSREVHYINYLQRVSQRCTRYLFAVYSDQEPSNYTGAVIA